MPPYAFEIHIFFQPTQLIFASFCFWPHQKFHIILSKSSHKLCGSWKQLIVYVGIAWVTALMRISFPPIERSLPFQPVNFCPILSFKMEKTCVLDLPMKDGSPKYLVCFECCIGPKMLKISSLISWRVFGLKNTEYLSVLIFWPEASSYLRRISFNSWHSSGFALQKRILSSAKKRWVTLGQPRAIEIPVKF